MKNVTIVVPLGEANLSSIAGSYEILTRANEFWKARGNRSLMELQVAGSATEPKAGTGFFSLHPVSILDVGQTDLIIIPSVTYHKKLLADNRELITWIREQYRGGSEIASICAGAFLLGATGLLDGKSCSTHWNKAAEFRQLFPDIDLQTDKLITAENGIYTNGGAFSFLNLMLFLVEKYFNRDIAIHCSKIFQIDMDRSTQSPFFIFQTQKNHGDDLICQAQAFIEENLVEKFSFEDLASRLAISRRNFDRRFVRATGNTPVEYLQRAKVERAKQMLERGRKTVVEVMNEVGYSDDKAFREVFKRITGLSPLEYRARYNRKAFA